MLNKLFVVSRIPNLASLLRNEISKRQLKSNAQGHLQNVEVVDVKLANEGPERTFLNSLVFSDEEVQQLDNAQIILIDNNLLSPLLTAIDAGKDRSYLSSNKWIQTTWAGIDTLFNDTTADIVKRNNITITRFSGPHFGSIMTEYVLAQIINYERGFYELNEFSRFKKQWKYFNWTDPTASELRRTDELSAVVLGGTGSIGSVVGKKLARMGMKIYAYGRKERSQKDIDSLCEMLGFSSYSNKLEGILPHVDYIISVLPCTPFTTDLLGNDTLSICKQKRPVLINVGRGNLISEQNIMKALDNGWIRHAILDVFRNEPLPKDSPIWQRDDVFITPHISAPTRGSDVCNFFIDNYLNHVSQKPLLYVVDFSSGY